MSTLRIVVYSVVFLLLGCQKLDQDYFPELPTYEYEVITNADYTN